MGYKLVDFAFNCYDIAKIGLDHVMVDCSMDENATQNIAFAFNVKSHLIEFQWPEYNLVLDCTMRHLKSGSSFWGHWVV